MDDLDKPKPFGLTVGRDDIREWRDGKLVPLGSGWRVFLPHQCDEWMVSGSYHGVPHGVAVAALERFIAEASEALEALRQEREFTAEEGQSWAT